MSWKSLQGALTAHRSSTKLAPPAAAEALAAATFAGAPPDVDLGGIWGVHDGSDGAIDANDVFVLLDLQTATKTHADMLAFVEEERLHGSGVGSSQVRGEVFVAGWIPFAADDERLLCIDFDPAPNGLRGQVIAVHTTEGVHGVVAESLEAFLANTAQGLMARATAGAPPNEDPQASRRSALQLVLDRAHEAGLDCGAILDDDLEVDPVFQIGQGAGWHANAQATRMVLRRLPGLQPRKLGLGDVSNALLDEVDRWGLPVGAREVARTTGGPPTTETAWVEWFVAALNRTLEQRGDLRRLWRIHGAGTPLARRFILLTPHERDALAALALLTVVEVVPAPSAQSTTKKGWLDRLLGR